MKLHIPFRIEIPGIEDGRKGNGRRKRTRKP
jgi:hypothetical protein